jgi:hypothetical protein
MKFPAGWHLVHLIHTGWGFGPQPHFDVRRTGPLPKRQMVHTRPRREGARPSPKTACGTIDFRPYLSLLPRNRVPPLWLSIQFASRHFDLRADPQSKLDHTVIQFDIAILGKSTALNTCITDVVVREISITFAGGAIFIAEREVGIKVADDNQSWIHFRITHKRTIAGGNVRIV